MVKTKFKKVGPMRLPSLLMNGEVVNFNFYTYWFPKDGYYYVIEKGEIKKSKSPLVRIHSACSFAHIFNSQRCDCEAQLEEAMLKIAQSNAGLIIYAWPHEGRQVGMWNHTKVYMKQDKGEDTVSSYEILGLPVDARNYKNCIEILKDYGIKRIRLLTNNPRKIKPLETAGLKVIRVPLTARLTKYNESQIKTKIEKLGHFYDLKAAMKKSQVMFYEGVKGIKFALNSMLEELTLGGEYNVFASGFMAPIMKSYYNVFQKEKVRRKINSLILYDEMMKQNKSILKKTKGLKKFYPLSPFRTDTFIFNNKVLIVSWKSELPFAVLMVDQESAETYRHIFRVLWNRFQGNK